MTRYSLEWTIALWKIHAIVAITSAGVTGSMTVFEDIKQAIVGHAVAAASVPNAQTGARTDSAAAQPGATLTGEQIVSALSSMAANNSQKLYWQTSIVDLMKLVGIDPNLPNRKQLAEELAYQGDTNDSIAMNVWLHSAVMRQLQSAGQVPGRDERERNSGKS